MLQVGVVRGTMLGMEYMSREKGGRGGVVVSTSSTTALVSTPIAPIYSSTKAAVNQFTTTIGVIHTLYPRGLRK